MWKKMLKYKNKVRSTTLFNLSKSLFEDGCKKQNKSCEVDGKIYPHIFSSEEILK